MQLILSIEICNRQRSLSRYRLTARQSTDDEYQRLEQHDRYLNEQCQFYAQHSSTDVLQFEFDYNQQLQVNYEHVQQQLTKCLNEIERNRCLQDDIRISIEKTHNDVQQLQTTIKHEKQVRL
jgi:hypothetical protein